MSGKTLFAGLEFLFPGESLSADGFYFQYFNPLRTDRLLELGAVTHRHDAHAAMVDPTTALTVTTAATGGSIPAGTPVYITYTLTDAEGGETLPVAAVLITTAAGYLDPTSAPVVAVDYTAGSLLAGSDSYAVTVTDGAGGETALGPAATVTVDPGHANARNNISGLTAIAAAASGGAFGAGWRIWRSRGGGPWYLMGTGAVATDTFVDDGTVPGDCTVAPPSPSTTLGANSITANVPAAGQPASAVSFSVYGSLDGTFQTPALLGTYPISDFGVDKVYTTLSVTDGAPPTISTCYPGASRIVADDITGPWKSPVADVAALPATGNASGDVRGVLDTHHLYTWDGAAWVPQPQFAPSLTRTDSTTPLTGLATATETAETLAAPGKGSLVYGVTVDAACRVRLYPAAALATADIARADSSDPDLADAASCYFDHVFTAAGTFPAPRAGLMVNMEGAPAATLAANVRVDSGGTAVTVVLHGYPVEA